jgi:tetratricopeptide (TPR) repeat protein
MAHVEPRQWVALTERRLPPDEESRVRAHAADCDTCRAQLAVAVQKRESVSDAPTRELSSSELERAKEIGKEPVLERGTTLGRFVVLDVLGVGGMGAVYSAYDPQLERKVAVKLLSAAGGPDATGPAQARMLREAQAMARLSHPNVVNVFEVGEHQGGIFIAMEYVPGKTLKDWLREKPRGWREVVSVFLQAGRGLAAAHAAHLVHRDFKPANVLIGEDGRARVTDFGVARADTALEPAPAAPSAPVEGTPSSLSDPITQHDTVVGTVGYMSPEQALAMVPDARSDQFSFCVSLWEALYDARPFTGATAVEVTKALVDAPLPPKPKATVPSWLHAALVRGLARQPNDRFPTMEALLAALDRRPLDWSRAAPWLAFAAVALAVLGWQALSRGRLQRDCAAIADVKPVWGDAPRAAVRQAFQAVNRPFAAAALASVERALDGYAHALSSRAHEACEAALLRNETSSETWALQQACYARRRAELGELVTNLSTAEEATVERAGTIVWGLTPVALCANTTRLRADPRLVNAKDQPKVAALQATLLKARALLDAGKLKGLEALLAQAIADAKDVGLKALEAEALSLDGALKQAQGKNADAAQAWQRAAALAHASGFDELFALAAVRLATLVGFQLNRPVEGRTWLALAEATIDRLGGDEVLTIERMGADARLFTAESRPLDAVPGHERALAYATKVLGPDNPLIWKLEYDLGSSLAAARDNGRAAVHLERALVLREKEVSGDHPDSAMVRSMLANAYFFSGRPKESREAFTRALAAREALFGPESPKLVVTLNNFGDTLLKSGAVTEALALVERGDAIARKSFPPGHPYIAATTLTRAECWLTQGRRADAKAALEELVAQKPPLPSPYLAEAGAVRSHLALLDGDVKAAFQLAEAAVVVARGIGPKSLELLRPLLAKGDAALALKRPAEAEAAFGEALALAEELKPWQVMLADAQLGLARARVAMKALTPEAKALAAKALATYRAADGMQARAATAEQVLAAFP